jgi:hypothetical protein
MNIVGKMEQGEPGALIVSLEESQASSVLPLWVTTDLGQGNTRASKTEVGGTDDHNAHSSIDQATNDQVRLFPFVCELQQEPFEELCCIAAYKAIRGDDE